MTGAGGVLAALASLFALVALGSIVPVVPTGAVVSATAVLAAHHDPVTPVVVIAVGALAAYAGDAVTYAVCRAGGESLTRRVTLSRRPVTIPPTVHAKLRGNLTSALVVARLVPAGRIPVLLAAALIAVPWRRFAVANVAACAVWSAAYAAVGLLGGAVLPEPWQGVLVVVAVVLAVSLLAGWIRHRREVHADAATSDGAR